MMNAYKIEFKLGEYHRLLQISANQATVTRHKPISNLPEVTIPQYIE